MSLRVRQTEHAGKLRGSDGQKEWEHKPSLKWASSRIRRRTGTQVVREALAQCAETSEEIEETGEMANQTSRTTQPPQKRQPRHPIIGKPGGVVGNSYAALSLLLAVVSQATGMDVAARATTQPLEPQGAPDVIPEAIEVRRARVSDLRSRASTRDVTDTFMIVCGGEDTLLCTFDEARDTLSRMPLLAHARWTLVDLATAPRVVDGR